MSEQKAKILIDKYLSGECSPEETAIVESWYQQFSGKQPLPGYTIDATAEKMAMLAAILNQRQPAVGKIRRLWPRIAAAASILVILSTGFYFFAMDRVAPPITAQETHLIKTGGNKAVLTLASGRQLTLTGNVNAVLSKEDGADATQTGEGQLQYIASSTTNNIENLNFNTIATPRGGQYQVTLADGTKVWLNAASSLKFPTAFPGKTREVQLSGEAYFEVAHMPDKPFRIITTRQTVEVLGTHFDVNAYMDETASRTTLLQGSVRLNQSIIIKPGEQATTSGSETNVDVIDTDDVIAWKDGKFRFANERITDLMRKIARWYDVDVDYEGDISQLTFSGSVSRFDRIEKLLNILQSTRTVHFKIAGRRITVMH